MKKIIYPFLICLLVFMNLSGASIHTVIKGETLYSISRQHSLSVSKISEWNNLANQTIKPGQILRLSPFKSETPSIAVIPEINREIVNTDLTRKQVHIVAAGESLYSLSKKYTMSLKELKKINNIDGNNISIGQKLSVKSTEIWKALNTDEVRTASYGRVERPDLSIYNNNKQEKTVKNYTEESSKNNLTPLSSYLIARNLWNNFDAEIDKLPVLSKRLEGVNIILDPSHGGLDSGSKIKIYNNKGEENYISEDEYMYDISLRSYLLLRLHGAKVITTIISPDHLIRNEMTASSTLSDNQKEVYNSREFNINDSEWDWPRAGSQAEMQRVEIAKEFTEGKDNTYWLSLQAHNAPDESSATGIYYYKYGSVSDEYSENWAFNLKKSWKRNAFVKGRELTVLEDNPAKGALVISLRNLAFSNEVNSLIMPTSRQMEAENIVTSFMHSLNR